MNVFDIIGPIMIGPSSSHTAGAVRLGRVANKVLNQEAPKEVMVELSGSFAKTYRGHGTDRALLAGIMGYHSYSEEIRDIFSIADKAGITYRFVPTQIPGSHPNTARIHVKGVNGTPVVVQGASIGGGNIRVDSINGMAVDFNGNTTPSWSPITTVRASLQKSRTSCGKNTKTSTLETSSFPVLSKGALP